MPINTLFIKRIFFVFILNVIILFKGIAADEIQKIVLHQHNDSCYLILHLFTYKPTEGSYEQGSIRTSGFNSSEIAVYNLSSGSLVVRNTFGLYNETNAFEILGCTDSSIWVYSKKYHSGLQAINFRTLEVQSTQAKIYNIMSGWTGSFMESPWNEIRENYGYSPINKSLIVTNYLKDQFLINIPSFKAEPNENKVQVTADPIISLTKTIYLGSDTLDIYNEYLNKNASLKLMDYHFNEGSFITETNIDKLCSIFTQRLNIYTDRLSDIDERLEQFRVSQNSSEYNKIQNYKMYSKQREKDAKENLEALIKGEKPDQVAMQTDSNSFYILKRESDDKNSVIAITKVAENEGFYDIAWETSLKGMFYNVSTAQDSKEFKKYFGNVLPESKFLHVENFDGKLAVIYLMQVAVLDIKTGDIMWYIRL